jgi:hypothetical protein
MQLIDGHDRVASIDRSSAAKPEMSAEALFLAEMARIGMGTASEIHSNRISRGPTSGVGP